MSLKLVNANKNKRKTQKYKFSNIMHTINVKEIKDKIVVVY
jgi:hypothetical protein